MSGWQEAGLAHLGGAGLLLGVELLYPAHVAVRPPELDEADEEDGDDAHGQDEGHLLPKLPGDEEGSVCHSGGYDKGTL